MAFPQTPLPAKVHISLDGTTWTDITTDVRMQDQIRIARGRGDWGQNVDAGRCSFSLSNTDGKYSPRNPEGTYYGQIGRNTPVRVSVETGSVALWLPSGSDSDYINTPDAAALDITGDIDIRLDATLLNWYLADTTLGAGATSVLTELAGKFTTTGNQRSWILYAQYGYLKFSWSEDGTSGNGYTVSSDDPLPLPASGRLAVRVTLDVNNGAGGFTIRFYTAESIDGPWTQFGTDGIGPATTSIFASTAPLRIGDGATDVGLTSGYTPALGYVHAFEVYNGIAGTAVANPDFTAQTSGATSFADAAGRTWTVSGNTEITNRKTRFVGEVSSWTPAWDTGGLDVITRVEAAGVMRRLSQGAVPAKSPMYREFTSPFRSNIVAYWPMEDESGATSLASALDGHQAISLTGSVTPAGYDDWPASDPVVTVGTGSMRALVPTYTATNYLFLRVFVAVPAAGVASTQRLFSFTQSGTARTWSVYVNTSGSLDLRAYDSIGTQILATGFFAYAVNGEMNSVGVELTQDGADIDYTLFVYDVGASTLTAASSATTTGTLAGYTVGAATQVRFGEDGAMNSTAFGHLAISDSNTGFASTAGALLGWNSETAAARVHRLGVEEDIAAYATAAGDEQMGVQARSTVLELMRAAQDVDEGILAEQRDVLGLRLVQRASMYNQTPAFTMDYTGDDGLVAPLDPVDDDQAVTNDVTVQRDGGSSARATLESGSLSTAAPPDGVGLYDTSVTLGLYSDSQPADHAGWRLHLGTWDETRFPQVTVNLAGAAGSIENAALVDVGSRLQITNPPVWLPPDTLDLLCQGYSEAMDQFAWTIVYNCTPYGPWNVAYEAEATGSQFGRADTDGCELVEALTTTETDVDVFTTSGPRWVQARPSMITNYDFETNLTGWTGNGATIARVATPGDAPFTGSWSMRLTPDGVAAFPNAGHDLIAVTAGKSYTLSGWQMCVTTRSVDLNINWFDGGGAYLSTSAGGQAVTANEWTWFQVTATAPVGAVFANASPTVPTTPPVTDILYSDMVTLRPAYTPELPQEFPFDVRAGGEVMRVTACTSAVFDGFNRTSANGWGTADSGQAWTVVGTAADYAVTPSYGSATNPATGIAHLTLATAPSADVDLYIDVATDQLATGASLVGGPIVRATDNNNNYMARLEFSTTAGITMSIRKRVAGVETTLATYTSPLTHVATTFYRVRFQVIGSTLRARLYETTALEPGDWHATATDTAITAANSLGTRAFRSTGNTTANAQFRYANLDLVNPQTMTVTRSVNGVSKAQSSGTDIRLAYPSHTGL